jgi:PQQ-like domain
LDSRDGSLISQGDLAGSGAALSLAFDARDGTVVLAGFVLAGPESNPVVAVAKFDASGDTVWTTSTSERGSPFTLAETVAVDPDTGNIALGGTLNTGQLVFFTMVLSPDGTERWRSDEIPGMAHSVTFAAGKVLAVGEFQEAAANVFAVMAFSEDGAEEWRQSFGPSSGSASAVAVESGTVFAAGRITNNPTGPDMFVVGLPLDR